MEGDRRVAIVDDEPDVVTLLEVVLGSEYEPIVIPPELSLDTAVWERTDPDVALVDYMMPGTSGLAVLELLRERFPAVKRILLTAAPLDMLPREVWQVADRIISKAVVAEDLRAFLDHW